MYKKYMQAIWEEEIDVIMADTQSLWMYKWKYTLCTWMMEE